MRSLQVSLQAGQALELLSTQTVLERMRGLLARPPLQRGQAMVLQDCNLVHTVGMRYPIDIVFVDRQARIASIHAAVPARRVRGCWRAVQVLELAAGEAARLGWQNGQRLPFLREAACP